MTLSIDTAGAREAIFANFAAGALRAPAHALIAAHLEMKPENRRFVADLEDFAAMRMEDAAPSPISDRQARLDAIFNSALAAPAMPVMASPIPRALQRYAGTRLDAIAWKTVLPGFREWEIGTEDGCEMQMLWIKPGRKMPTHTHEGTELFLVLEGSFTDDTGRYGPGDISIADEGVTHRPVAGMECPCIGFSVTDAPLRLTGTLRERIGMLFGR